VSVLLAMSNGLNLDLAVTSVEEEEPHHRHHLQLQETTVTLVVLMVNVRASTDTVVMVIVTVELAAKLDLAKEDHLHPLLHQPLETVVAEFVPRPLQNKTQVLIGSNIVDKLKEERTSVTLAYQVVFGRTPAVKEILQMVAVACLVEPLLELLLESSALQFLLLVLLPLLSSAQENPPTRPSKRLSFK